MFLTPNYFRRTSCLLPSWVQPRLAKLATCHVRCILPFIFNYMSLFIVSESRAVASSAGILHQFLYVPDVIIPPKKSSPSSSSLNLFYIILLSGENNKHVHYSSPSPIHAKSFLWWAFAATRRHVSGHCGKMDRRKR